MNTYDQIIASAYYVFGDKLTSRIVSSFLVLSSSNGNKFEEDELKLNKLKGIIKFNNHFFILNDGYSISDISECINFDMVVFFFFLKNSRDKYYSSYEEKQKIMRKRKSMNGE